MSTPRDYEGSLRAIEEMVALIERTVGERGTVGIGIPGMVSQRTGVVKNANSTWLIGKPLERVLEERLGRPVRLMNDANCFTLSEATDGAGAGFDSVFGVILGTGVGGGITIGRRVHVGANLIGGEWGHNPLPWPELSELPGPPCYCGRRGCIETWLSGPGMERRSSRADGRVAHDARDRARRRVGRRERVGDDRALPRPARTRTGVGRQRARPRRDRARRRDVQPARTRRWRRSIAMRPHVFSDTVETVVRRNVHGDSSGVRGAAWLWPERLTDLRTPARRSPRRMPSVTVVECCAPPRR